MRLWVLGTGSRGNAVLVESDGARVLVDAGFGVRAIAERLAAGLAHGRRALCDDLRIGDVLVAEFEFDGALEDGFTLVAVRRVSTTHPREGETASEEQGRGGEEAAATQRVTRDPGPCTHEGDV